MEIEFAWTVLFFQLEVLLDFSKYIIILRILIKILERKKVPTKVQIIMTSIFLINSLYTSLYTLIKEIKYTN